MILVISYSDEEHTADVLQRLESMGREVHLIDLADFPAQTSLALSWADDKVPSYFINNGRARIDLRNTNVVWWRRVRSFTIDGTIQDPSHRAFAHSETSQAVYGMLDALSCPWINDRLLDEAAHHKPYQWEIAHQVGLRLPKTLVTNEPAAAREFIDRAGGGKTVFKAFLASLEAWRETRLIEPDNVAQINLVRLAPVIFQEYVEGVDLRITVVGDKVFPAEIDARNTSYPVDMRMVVGETDVKPAKLPPKITKALLELMRRLGLTYGAIDMRRTADGEYVFFEVNPAGQWLFVEQRAGLQVSQAMADLLAKFDNSNKMTPGK